MAICFKLGDLKIWMDLDHWTIHLRATSDVCNFHVFGLCWECLHKDEHPQDKDWQISVPHSFDVWQCKNPIQEQDDDGEGEIRQTRRLSFSAFVSINDSEWQKLSKQFSHQIQETCWNVELCLWSLNLVDQCCPQMTRQLFRIQNILGFAGFAMPEREPHHTCRTRCGGRNFLSMLKSLKCFEEEFSWRHAIHRSSLICSNHNNYIIILYHYHDVMMKYKNISRQPDKS